MFIKKTIPLLGILALLIITPAYAFEFDNVKRVTDIGGQYPEVTIVNAFGLGSDLMKIRLIENTEHCAADCHAILEIVASDKIDLPKEYSSTWAWGFDNLNSGTRKYLTHNLEIATTNRTEQVLTGSECKEKDNPDSKNATKVYDCYNTYKNVSVFDFKPLGSSLPSGQFWVKLSGAKKMHDNLDWYPTFLGINLKEEYAKWLDVDFEMNYTFDEGDFANTGTSAEFATPSAVSGSPVYQSDTYIDTAALNVSGAVWKDASYNYGAKYGTLGYWFRVGYSPVSTGPDSLILYDASGNNVGDFQSGWNTPAHDPNTNGTASLSVFNTSGHTSLYSGEVIQANTWYHWVGKTNASGTFFYLNGALQDFTDGGTNKFFGSTDPNGIWYLINSGENLNLTIDELKFTTAEVSESDILSWFNTENGTILPSLTINLNEPANNTITTSTTLTFNTSADAGPDALLNSTLFVWYSNGTQFYTNTITSGGSINESVWSVPGFNEGSYKWNAWWESDTPDGDMAAENQTFAIDLTDPSVSIVTPAASYYNETNLSFTFTAGDSHLDSCWYKINSGSAIALPSCLNSTAVGGVTDINNLTIYANDSAGNSGAAEVRYGIFNVSSITYTTPLLEFQTGTYRPNITFDYDLASGAGLSVSPNVTLYINGTATNAALDGYTCVLGECSSESFLASYTMPVNTSGGNYSFYFNISWPAATKGSLSLVQASYLSATNWQEVQEISVFPCLSNSTTIAINVSCWYAETRGADNCTLDYVFEYWPTTKDAGYKTLNGSSGLNHTHYFCIAPATGTLYTDALLESTNANSVSRSYYLRNDSLTISGELINLYLLNSSLSTTFLVEVQDSLLRDAEDRYVVMQRYYPDIDSYITTEIGKTNFVGETLLHIYAENPLYRFLIYDYTALTKSVTAFKPYCSGSCLLNFVEQDDITDYFKQVNPTTLYNVSYDGDSISYAWSDSGGATSSARLVVLKSGATSDLTICDTTTTSASGAIICNISGNGTGSYLAKPYITQSGSTTILDTLGVTSKTNYLIFGTEGMFYAILIVIAISFVGLALGSPIIALLLPMMSLFSLTLIEIINIPFATLVGMFVLVLFVVIKMRN